MADTEHEVRLSDLFDPMSALHRLRRCNPPGVHQGVAPSMSQLQPQDHIECSSVATKEYY